MTNIYNGNSSSKAFPSICDARGCLNYATTHIAIPLNDHLICVVKVCEKCIPKFWTKDSVDYCNLRLTMDER